jgi:hypothetical protein
MNVEQQNMENAYDVCMNTATKKKKKNKRTARIGGSDLQVANKIWPYIIIIIIIIR